MFTLSKLLPAERMAVMYVTVGALTDVWSGIWFFYLRNNVPGGNAAFYWCYGFLLTGLTLMLIGLGVGWISRRRRTERHGEMREEMSLAAMQAEKAADLNTRLTIVPSPSATPGVATNGRRIAADVPI